MPFSNSEKRREARL